MVATTGFKFATCMLYLFLSPALFKNEPDWRTHPVLNFDKSNKTICAFHKQTAGKYNTLKTFSEGRHCITWHCVWCTWYVTTFFLLFFYLNLKKRTFFSNEFSSYDIAWSAERHAQVTQPFCNKAFIAIWTILSVFRGNWKKKCCWMLYLNNFLEITR